MNHEAFLAGLYDEMQKLGGLEKFAKISRMMALAGKRGMGRRFARGILAGRTAARQRLNARPVMADVVSRSAPKTPTGGQTPPQGPPVTSQAPKKQAPAQPQAPPAGAPQAQVPTDSQQAIQKAERRATGSRLMQLNPHAVREAKAKINQMRGSVPNVNNVRTGATSAPVSLPGAAAAAAPPAKKPVETGGGFVTKNVNYPSEQQMYDAGASSRFARRRGGTRTKVRQQMPGLLKESAFMWGFLDELNKLAAGQAGPSDIPLSQTATETLYGTRGSQTSQENIAFKERMKQMKMQAPLQKQQGIGGADPSVLQKQKASVQKQMAETVGKVPPGIRR